MKKASKAKAAQRKSSFAPCAQKLQRAEGGQAGLHVSPMLEARLNHRQDIVLREAGAQARANHVVYHQLNRRIDGPVRADVVALGNERPLPFLVEIYPSRSRSM